MQRRIRFLWLLGLFVSVLFAGCRQPPQQAPLRSLRASGKTTFVCLGPDGRGRPLADCAQGARISGGLALADSRYALYALVTQTISAEVAVVRLSGGRGVSGVIDVDPSNPGITPLRVGAKPVDIVSTPGGRATFVGVAEPGRAGIFGLGSQCITAPRGSDDEEETPTIRDLTSWPACSLPTAPGDMQIVLDPTDDQGRVRLSCDGEYVDEVPEPASAAYECGADLRGDPLVGGRAKLLVALPDWGQLAVFDAQELMNRVPGTFDPCVPEVVLPLQNSLAETVRQPLPEDLVVDGCTESVQEYGPYDAFSSQPAGMALRDGRLYVADRGGPLVHVLDVTNACQPLELPPLVATSLVSPGRVVTTSKVAVSPPTTRGEQFVYAIDDVGEETASVMIFDVSPGRTQRTPLVRQNSTLVPLEPPDRLEFSGAAKDVAFAFHDSPLPDLVTGEARSGVFCDPNPDIDPDSTPARYRTTSDQARGARPAMLRGIFGFVLLSNGRVAVIDVEDFDAPCRRPAETNTADVFNFRGCANDDREEPYVLGGARTVSGEVTCRAVVQHEPRSARLITTNSRNGVNAPSLRALPRLSRNGRGLPVSHLIRQGQVNPLLAAVDFESPVPGGDPIPAQTYVGVTLRERGTGRDDLVIDPTLAEQASVALPFLDPRAYAAQETMSVTFEGPIVERSGGLLAVDGSRGVLEDQDALFCAAGVQDLDLAQEFGATRFGLSSEQLEAFGERHGDYVQIVTSLLPSDHSYWQGAGAQCGGAGYDVCATVFGVGTLEEPPASRDLRILEAYQDRLVVEPRTEAADLDLIACCFPQALTYRVRAGNHWVVRGSISGFPHDVEASPTDYRCVRGCAPWRARTPGRVFEVSSTLEDCPRLEETDPDEPLPPGCAVGRATADDLVCTYDSSSGPVSPGGPASECIYDGLTSRFVVYRGLEPTLRDMAYSYEIVGGFAPLAVSLTASTSVVLPVFVRQIPGFDVLSVLDAEDRGLMLVGLRSLTVQSSFF